MNTTKTTNRIIRVTRERHQGKREMARRLHQADKGQIKISRILGRITLPSGIEKVVWNE